MIWEIEHESLTIQNRNSDLARERGFGPCLFARTFVMFNYNEIAMFPDSGCDQRLGQPAMATAVSIPLHENVMETLTSVHGGRMRSVHAKKRSADEVKAHRQANAAKARKTIADRRATAR